MAEREEALQFREEEGEELAREAEATGARRLAVQLQASDNLWRRDGLETRARRVGGGGGAADGKSRGEQIERRLTVPRLFRSLVTKQSRAQFDN
jgi:hypothetical protein